LVHRESIVVIRISPTQNVRLVFKEANSALPLLATFTLRRIRVFSHANNSFLVRESSLINMFLVFLGEITMGEDRHSHNCPTKEEPSLLMLLVPTCISSTNLVLLLLKQ
jgi:hypothetical protein